MRRDIGELCDKLEAHRAVLAASIAAAEGRTPQGPWVSVWRWEKAPEHVRRLVAAKIDDQAAKSKSPLVILYPDDGRPLVDRERDFLHRDILAALAVAYRYADEVPDVLGGTARVYYDVVGVTL